MTYNDQENKTSEKRLGPHPDLQENVNFFHKQMARVNWLPTEQECPVAYEISDRETNTVFDPQTGKHDSTSRIKEYKCVIFIFPKGNERMTTTISFHQPSRKTQYDPGFKEQLCDALNYFGAQGWLEHKTRNADGTSRDSKYEKPAPSKWNELFNR